ncbi:hypothetical protein QTI33_23385 [Variovorax sp. J22P271]|uniref:hypothetical protein n=1 Tax=Variovorax davisae TaxID=3053515 RepID=UPI002576877C|nr:hypothetical protein [Variovorax sp. J22P271]MDM0035097.1 hypothetical protein [Variovorax sp. J22P271]
MTHGAHERAQERDRGNQRSPGRVASEALVDAACFERSQGRRVTLQWLGGDSLHQRLVELGDELLARFVAGCHHHLVRQFQLTPQVALDRRMQHEVLELQPRRHALAADADGTVGPATRLVPDLLVHGPVEAADVMGLPVRRHWQVFADLIGHRRPVSGRHAPGFPASARQVLLVALPALALLAPDFFVQLRTGPVGIVGPLLAQLLHGRAVGLVDPASAMQLASGLLLQQVQLGLVDLLVEPLDRAREHRKQGQEGLAFRPREDSFFVVAESVQLRAPLHHGPLHQMQHTLSNEKNVFVSSSRRDPSVVYGCDTWNKGFEQAGWVNGTI